MNILQISDTAEFDNSVWQTKTDFSEKDYNKWLRNAGDNLQRIKDLVEDIQGGADAKEISIKMQDIDIYMMGDVINLLSSIQVDTEYRATTWVVTEDDFQNWRTDSLTPEQKRELIDTAADLVSDNESMATDYNECIALAAEKFSLEERPVCAHCGRILTEGYCLNGYYACPDGDCMASVLHEHEGVPMEDADKWFTRVSEVENNGKYFTWEE